MSKKIPFISRYLPYFLAVFLITGFFALGVWMDNLPRAAVLLLLSGGFIISCKRNTPPLVVAFILFIVALPLNITMILPSNIFGMEIYNCSSRGVPSNYYRIVLSVLDVAMVALVVTAIWQWRKRFVDWIKKDRFFLFVVAVSAIWIVISTIIYKDTVVLFKQIRFFGYILTFTFLATKQLFGLLTLHKRKIFIALAISILLQALIILAQFLAGSSVGFDMIGESTLISGYYGTSAIIYNGTVFLRGYGTFAHPNVVAAYLLFGIMIFNAFSGFSTRLKLAVTAVATVAVLLTFSRMALFVLLVHFCFKILDRVTTKGRARIMGLSFPGVLLSRVVSIFNFANSSSSERIALMKNSVEYLRSNPYLGVGFGNFVQYMGTIASETLIISNGRVLYEPVHNIFMLFFVENGIIAGVVFTVLLLGLILISGQLAFKHKRGRVLWLSIFVWFLIFSNFDHFFITLPQGVAMLAVFTAFCKSFLISIKSDQGMVKTSR